MDLKTRIDIAAGRRPADLVLRGGRIVNVLSCEIHDGDVAIAGEHIAGIGRYDGRQIVDLKGRFVCPAFIDAHVHIESSMLAPPQFARVIAPSGTGAVVIDPHEIANVMGLDGIRYMLAASEGSPVDVFAMASSCVPASRFESAGASLSAQDLAPLLDEPRVLGLAEMMDYPGIVQGDATCLAKLAMIGRRPVDGHAPGLTGDALCAYIAAGIGSDHECTTLDEAREKLRLGLHIMIRQGSQARNLDALAPLIRPETLDQIMFCTDDKDVDDLLAEGQIVPMIRRAIALGVSPIHAIRVASHSAARYFGLAEFGAFAPGRLANIAVLDDLKECRVSRVYHHGQLVAQDSAMLDSPAGDVTARLRAAAGPHSNSVHIGALGIDRFAVRVDGDRPVGVHVMHVMEDRIDTQRSIEPMSPRDGQLRADVSRDLLKIAVVERHHATGRVGLGVVRGFGLRAGAIASTVGHDAHNLVVAGASDADMAAAVQHLAKIGGGFCVVRDGHVLADVPLPIAGLMSDGDATTLSAQLRQLHDAASRLGDALRRPFMALSFLSLSVIGRLKVTDRGLVDVDRFELIDLVAG